MSRKHYRFGSWLLVFVTMAVLGASLYFEYVTGLNPCPLCLMQRLCVVLLLFTTIFAVYLQQTRLTQKVVLTQLLLSCAGLFFALRQVWIQMLPPDQIPACVPGLRMIMHYLPWRDVLHILLFGAGDCAEASWRWLGLSMAAWSSLYFLGMLGASLFFYRDLKKQKPFKKPTHSRQSVA